MAEELFVKPVRALTWSSVGSEAAIIERIAAGDEDACAELVLRRSGTDLRPLFLPERESAADSADLAALLGRGGAAAHTFGPLDHAEVLEAGRAAGPRIGALLAEVIRRVAADRPAPAA